MSAQKGEKTGTFGALYFRDEAQPLWYHWMGKANLFPALAISFILVHWQTHEWQEKKAAQKKPEIDSEARSALRIGRQCGNAR